MANDPDGVIIVLGSPNDRNGRLYDVAIGRCKTAIRVYKKHPGYKLLLTGGYGTHFNESNRPHARYLAEYLIQSGLQKKDILEFAESANSIEDATLSKPIIQKYDIKNIIIVTSDYHVDRAKYIFNQIYENIPVNISFSTAITDIKNSELDIRSLIKHEKFSLNKLKKYGMENYYKI